MIAEFDPIMEEHLRRKYFYVILDCTPNVSHEEQIYLILRCVNVSTNPITMDEIFPNALFLELKNILEILKLDMHDIRGQGYDNSSNMKGQYKGVSNR
ncbi:hypothetical protein DCAR_0727561 [Daucus carota subsp. sativus]|uniref:DUF4371 domain-containing protein n=1 Tax=Daucus carota subsp. sativus TaxID=79200 RepID=A0AAF0XJT2_DAUCS|nr:hypothetical protein DCAR_0727561 [Daucus carota subsp. sativus]